MKFSRSISTIDSHTAGEGTRLVVGGLPPIPGESMAEKLAYVESHFPWLPGFLLLEPRGHKDLFGAMLVSPCNPEADFGIIYMDNQGYEPMCGHATIGAAVSVLEMGMSYLKEPETTLTFDTPAGLVRACARIDDGQVVTVSFDNVPSFVYRSNVTLQVPEIGELTIDVVFGGLFFVFVDARQIQLDLIPENASRLASLGMQILEATNQQISVCHPELPHINKIIDLRFYIQPGNNGADSRNVVILGDHMIDRSPCGTGTSAETALRHANGQLAIGESFITESIIGTRFTGQAVEETHVGAGDKWYSAVIPRVTGSAFVTGFNRFVLAEDDPFPQGFLLNT